VSGEYLFTFEAFDGINSAYGEMGFMSGKTTPSIWIPGIPPTSSCP
jgi:hypothetical protein